MKNISFVLIMVTITLVFSGTMAQANFFPSNLDGIAGSTYNPANLLNEKKFELALSAGVEVGTSSWSPLLIKDLMAKDLTEADKNVLTDGIPDSGFALAAETAPFFGMKYGNLGLRVSGVGVAQGQINKDVFDLLFHGNELERTYRVDDSQAWASGYLEAAATLNFNIPFIANELGINNFAIGASGKYLYGLAHAQFAGEGFVKTSIEEVAEVYGEGQATQRFSTKGTGMAFDLGVTTAINDQLTLNFSVLNLGSITWVDVETTEYEFLFNLDEETYEPAITKESIEPNHNWILPLSYRAAAIYDPNPKLSAIVEVTNTANEEFSNTVLRVGIEYLPWQFLPLRVSANKGTSQQLTIDGGIGLEFANMSVDIFSRNILAFFAREQCGFSFGLNIGFGL